MPWCPKCKCEYKEGFTVCIDCGSPLVEENNNSPTILLCTFNKSDNAKKFVAYLEYSQIKCECKETETSEPYLIYEVYVEEAKKHEAKAALKAFVNVEDNLFAKQNIDSTYFIGSFEDIDELIDDEEAEIDITDEFDDVDSEDENSDDNNYRNSSRFLVAKDSVIYESKLSKAEESYGSGLMLICVGIIGIVARIYLMKGDFTLDFSSIVIFIVFIAMIIYGIVSIRDSKKYRIEAKAENDFINSVQNWLSENISKADLISQDTPGESEEINYFKRTAYVKKVITDNFSDLDDNFVDNMVEEFYESVFQK